MRRTDFISPLETGGISVLAAEPELAGTLGATVRVGHVPRRRHRAATRPSCSARRRPRCSGSTGVDGSAACTCGGHWFTVIGILDPVELAPAIDRAALIGFPVAEAVFGIDGSASTRLRAHRRPTRSTPCATCCPPTANPRPPTRWR